ncbi:MULTISPECIES: cobalt-precorrin-5B (C(1))-methyltransferase [Caldilinea]|jgi:cobalt-precorrin-5B (C1)-methyltransferase|uniref:Cobalt-precorrin-5B C(1)-methyltransferase n=1 Tax=Caldilinea aerophila (strain DSM 14535 / JCM 11387 / NBRC 104270 / STL-6-O1) TaxID=926550 RepID=I0I593_CALAS|nr:MULTISPECIES: cobalt-precorrin-5B (C(1))-methyltransferase [Caldilinea]MBO9392946.1 cobalt-precorrin-5B (C(1))-methyltransferase [Caldilinea sp.]BAM00431.1 putative cobalt-precorrin-6A synthase [deacetylating] [Caldilinea aerophila DSM 14535 = NBRC 104270]GIV71785.1 MAG: cobalt-precorrin-5B C(1)-methyltransferase [Caldilinea sp.]
MSDAVPPRNRRGGRTGYTTGSNAAAAAKAATLALFTRRWPQAVTITLPIGETATMTPVHTRLDDQSAYCCMIKDAGDDPDVTHGALICAEVRIVATPGIHIDGGVGVGRVTLPGIGLPVGAAAINPVPRRQIEENVRDAVIAAAPGGAAWLVDHGLEVIISVPDGERLAQRTLNPRLGILGGISILGTTGKVFPYSTAAWRASVVQAVEMAATNHVERVVLATGGRSERFAMQLFPELPEIAFVELSVFTGDALKTCVAMGVRSVVFVGMIGKMIKTAQGHMQTHVAGNQVDFAFLARVCQEAGAPEALVEAVAGANTGRHFLELCLDAGFLAPLQRIAELALEACLDFVRKQGGGLEMETILIDFDGNVLGRARGVIAPPEAEAPRGAAVPLLQRLADDPAHAYDDDEPLEETT